MDVTWYVNVNDIFYVHINNIYWVYNTGDNWLAGFHVSFCINLILQTMYENVISMLDKFYKTHMNKVNVKDEDVLRLVSTSGLCLSSYF